MRNHGLTKVAQDKIWGLEAVPVLVETVDSNQGSPVPLRKYMWVRQSLLEQVEWLDHMIADFGRRRTDLLNHSDNQEYFREYIQRDMIGKGGEHIFLSLQHGPEAGSPLNNSPIHAYDWDDEKVVDEAL